MHVCTALQTDNHASTPPLCFLQAGCPSCRPTNSVEAPKANKKYLGLDDVLAEAVATPEDVEFAERFAGADEVRQRLDRDRTARHAVHHHLELRNVLVLDADDLEQRTHDTLHYRTTYLLRQPVSRASVRTHPFNGPLTATTRVSRYQKGKTNLDFTEARDRVAVAYNAMAICKSAPLSRQITTPAPHHSVFSGRMPFLLPNQQRQSTEGKQATIRYIYYMFSG